MKPLLSVIITSYNREKTISRAIESVLSQTFKDYELIIIDDCSNDRSFEIAKTYASKEKRVHAYRNDVNKGLLKNKFLGYLHTSGKYFVFLDSDDYYTDNCFFEKAMSVFENDDSITMLLARGSYVSKKGSEENDLLFEGKVETREYIKHYQTKYNRTFQGAIILKKSSFEQTRVKIYDVQLMDDVVMILLGTSENGYIYGLDDNVINYEMQANSASKNINKELISYHIKGTKLAFEYYKELFNLSNEWLNFQLKILLSFYAWSYGLKVNNLLYVYRILSVVNVKNKNKLLIQYIKDVIYLKTKGKHDHDKY